MRSEWKAMVVAGALAFCLVVLVGMPGQASAATIEFGILTTLPQFQFGQEGSNTFLLNNQPILEGNTYTFSLGGSDVSLGGVRPPIGPGPGPVGDQAYQFLDGSSVMLGGVRPPAPPGPGPIGDGLLNFNSGVVLNGTLTFALASDYVIPAGGAQMTLMTSPFAFTGSFDQVILPDGWSVESISFQSGSTTTYALIASAPAPVPEPSTMLLLGSGLAGLVGSGIRRFRKPGSKTS